MIGLPDHQNGVAVVVAHPDDEILWLSSAVASADRVILCFGDPFERPKLAAARRRAVACLDLPGLIDLKLPESGAGFSVDWARARPTDAGIEIAAASARARYEAGFPVLRDALRQTLAGCHTVYTHNPWGEYGHAEHIQVHRAVASLQAEFGFDLCFSNYVGPLSWPVAERLGATPCWTRRRTVRPDLATAGRLMAIYRRHHAWTWSRFHRWPAHETLYTKPSAGPDRRRPMAGEWLRDVASLRRWPTPWRQAGRFLSTGPGATH